MTVSSRHQQSSGSLPLPSPDVVAADVFGSAAWQFPLHNTSLLPRSLSRQSFLSPRHYKKAVMSEPNEICNMLHVRPTKDNIWFMERYASGSWGIEGFCALCIHLRSARPSHGNLEHFTLGPQFGGWVRAP